MSDEPEPPDIASWLDAFIATRKYEYEQQFETQTDDENALMRVLDTFEQWAELLITRGEVPPQLAAALSEYMPGDSAATKVRALLAYQVVHHRLEFDIATTVADRLRGLDKRVMLTSLLTILLVDHSQSPIARKYFERATRLFLAGYGSETVIMSAAVLEAALTERFPDDLLAARYPKRPKYREAGYSITQRLEYEEMYEPLFDVEERVRAKRLRNWRNDAVHVQPDIVPAPTDALMVLAVLLPKIFPSDSARGNA